MVDSRCLRKFYVLCCLTTLAACSNGRGSVDTEQPPSGPAQGGFTVGGMIAGLDGNGLVLQLNGAGDLAVANDGSFTFTGELADATAYNVTVLTQPSAPSQTCSIANGSGTIAGANVTNVSITCATGAFALRGTVSGLAGTGLVLQNNGGDALPVSANGAFAFPTPLASGAPYNVTVATQPSGPSQSCSVTNGSGTMGGADVTNVTVTCATGSFAIGGTISALAGSGLVLQNNGGNDLAVNGNGPFQFSALLASGAAYNVTVKTHPTGPTQSCTVTNGSGTVGSASVMNIAVTCATDRFTIGGTTSGLAGSGLTLQLNGGNDFQVPANGPFAFPVAVPSGTPYVVSVRRQPSNPAQNCSVASGVGVVLGANVTNVAVTCTTNSFSIGGMVNGLQGSGLVLQKNGGDDLAIASNGSFTFQTDQASGTSYQVTVRTQPVNPSQSCTVENAGGTVGSGNVRNVRVTCSTNTFSIGGTVSGLLGTGLVLSNNGGDNLPIGADGGFTFPKQLASGATFNVTVHTQPGSPTQACTVGNGSGTVGAGNVTSVVVNCSTSDFTVGGSVGGLAGSGLVLQNNGGDDLSIGSDGSFTFPTAIPSGAPYSVTVAAQPTGPAQSCTVANGSGVVGAENVTNISVSCVTTEFSIGGSVSGLTGSGLVLQNNGADNLAIASDGSFTFPTSLPTGTPYSVTVAAQPSTPVQVCTVVNGVGIVEGADVATVAVSCVDVPPI
jgi:environmental stress-induced protein Ves